MRRLELWCFFADGGGVRHGGEGWCLRERIPTIACYGRGLSIASGAPDLPPTCHTALAFSVSARFRPWRGAVLADLERCTTQRRSGSRRLGAGRCAPPPLVSSPRAPLRGAKTTTRCECAGPAYLHSHHGLHSHSERATVWVFLIDGTLSTWAHLYCNTFVQRTHTVQPFPVDFPHVVLPSMPSRELSTYAAGTLRPLRLSEAR